MKLLFNYLFFILIISTISCEDNNDSDYSDEEIIKIKSKIEFINDYNFNLALELANINNFY